MMSTYIKLSNYCKNLFLTISSFFGRKRGILVYLGMNRGLGFRCIFRNYEKCYGFEPNPVLYSKLKNKYKKYPNVFIYNYAVSDRFGKIEFNIANNGGLSSSIGKFSEEWEPYNSGRVRVVSTIEVETINLYEFLKLEGVDEVDTYVSDIQGYDLTVLKTLKPFLDEQRIRTITSEVTKDEYRNIYADLPDNSESGFIELLSQNYQCVSKGWGILRDGEFMDVPRSWWEMDWKWKAKSSLTQYNV